MPLFAGPAVSLEQRSICIVDSAGQVIRELKANTDGKDGEPRCFPAPSRRNVANVLKFF